MTHAADLPADAEAFLQEHSDIDTIEVLLPDINSVMRGKWLPANRLSKVYTGQFKLPVTTLAFDIWGRDVEELVFDEGDADGICLPVADSLRLIPWLPNTAQLLVQMHSPCEQPYVGDPRTVLADVLTRYRERGMFPVTTTEVEFYLLRPKTPDAPFSHSSDRLGSNPPGGDTYGVESLQEQRAVLNDIRRACDIQGIPMDGILKESAPSQYELNLRHVDDPLLAADHNLLVRRIIRGVATQHGMIASFMAKLQPDHAGNGMHVHVSVLNEAGDNIFDDGTERGSEQLRHAIAGCATHTRDCMAIFAPNLNSYRRLQPGSHAPTTASWGYDNRTVALRVPASDPTNTRIEHRLAGSDANPHLVLAAILAAALDGLDRKLEADAPVAGDAYSGKSGRTLPVEWGVALECFEQSVFVREHLGATLQRNFSLSKQQELATFRADITPLEYSSYLSTL